MKKMLYLFLIVPLVFSSCKKEEGCVDSLATNYNADAEEDDGSCTYSLVGTWNMTAFIAGGVDAFNVSQEPHMTNGSLNINSSLAYTLTVSNSFNYTETNTGTWAQNGNTFAMTDSDSGDIESFTIDELTGSKFEISGSMDIEDNGQLISVEIKFNK